jgi:16S rRNA (adenine1518-N6/adenine1519-N6)-dimethyltransferase
MLIKGASFYPVPRVDSQGLRLDLLPENERISAPLFQPLVRSLFSSRRKTIKNNLINFVPSVILEQGRKGEDAAREALDLSGLSGERRAETLSIGEFASLAEALEKIRNHGS